MHLYELQIINLVHSWLGQLCSQLSQDSKAGQKKTMQNSHREVQGDLLLEVRDRSLRKIQAALSKPL